MAATMQSMQLWISRLHVSGIVYTMLALLAVNVSQTSCLSTGGGEKEPTKVCDWDVFFEPRCDSSEVLLIGHALYGRMRPSRCITDDFGYIGCSADVLGLLNSKCAGRRSCQLAVVRMFRTVNSTCPAGISKYLEVEYRCVKVAYPIRGYCDSNAATELPNTSGYLASLITQETGCGSSTSPWQVTANPGQQFRFKLWTFSDGEESLDLPDVSSDCDVYVELTEDEPNTHKRVCARAAISTDMYTSRTNIVDIKMAMTNNGHGQTNYFVMEYEAFGCAHRAPPYNGWIIREGSDLHLGCNETSEVVHQWKMQCNGTHWIGGDYTCIVSLTTTSTKVPTKTTTEESIDEPSLFTTEGTMYIIVITGLAIVVGLCIALSATAVYIVRHRRRQRRTPDDYATQDYSTQSRQTSNIADTSLKRNGRSNPDGAVEADHYWTWQTNRRGPNTGGVPIVDDRSLAAKPCSRTLRSTTSEQRSAPEECTMLVRKTDNQSARYNAGKGVSDYDRLDPDLTGSSIHENISDEIMHA